MCQTVMKKVINILKCSWENEKKIDMEKRKMVES